MILPKLGNYGHQSKRIPRSVLGPLFKITLDAGHLVGDVRKTDDGFVFRLGKGIKRRRFHFYGQQPHLVAGIDRRGGFAERCVGGPC